MKRLTFLAAAIAAVTLVVSACSGGSSSPATRAPSSGAAEPEGPESLRQPPLIRGPVSPDGLQAILATSDLGLGKQRFGFLLTDREGFVLIPAAQLSLRHLDGGAPKEVKAAATAENRPWPFGIRGEYATELSFDRPGKWAIDIQVKGSNGSVKSVELAFPVRDRPSVPGPGAPAPRSNTRTVRDVPKVSELSTGSLHDPDFYQVRLAEALASGRPTVFVLASPAFCTNESCGPILETVQMLKDRFKGQANFVHADFFDNPGQLQDDLSNARKSQVASDWGVTDTEWTFVIDRSGVVAHKFEGYATIEELESALKDVL